MAIRLNLGCGYRAREGFINVDIRALPGVDLQCDVSAGLPLPDNCACEVRAVDFLEHIPIGKTVAVIEEIWRVLEPGGLFHHMTPSTDGRGAFQDPTHVSFWNINSWLYYSDDTYRELYGIKAKFTGELRDVETDKERRVIHTIGNLYAVKGV